MSALSLYAGPVALRRLNEEGLKPELFGTLAGASGGPKWFVLYGLDRYLFGNFFAARTAPLTTIGSSSGAWRLACLATTDPVGALDRLASRYSREDYSADPGPREITGKARDMLQAVLGPTGAGELVDNTRIHSHFITNRCRGPLSADSRLILSAGLGMAAASNLLNRTWLGLYLERVVFKSHSDDCAFESLEDLPTHAVGLTSDNVVDALIASGSIPLVLEGVRDIAGAPAGLYVDGGITDYHLNLPFRSCGELVLYPHFYPWLVPGWFDKYLSWRRIDLPNFENVLLVAPSAEFVASLPFGRIPDRDDFRRLGYDQRVRYWAAVLDESHRLADEFQLMVESGTGLDLIQPLQTQRGR